MPFLHDISDIVFHSLLLQLIDILKKNSLNMLNSYISYQEV